MLVCNDQNCHYVSTKLNDLSADPNRQFAVVLRDGTNAAGQVQLTAGVPMGGGGGASFNQVLSVV